MMTAYGFIKVAAGVPFSIPADLKKTAEIHIHMIKQAHQSGCAAIVFPELSLTSYTCQDLFTNTQLLHGVVDALDEIREKTKFLPIVSIVGLPLFWQNGLYNTAAVLYHGEILGIVPKSYIPNYREFYEVRWFRSGKDITGASLLIHGNEVPFGTDLVFRNSKYPLWTFGIEICEDLWVPVPPSCRLAENGAHMIFNLSASNIIVGKEEYRQKLVEMQSARLICGYVYCAAGTGESTTDLVFDGDVQVFENGTRIASSTRFLREDQLIIADIDLEKLALERARTTTFPSGLSSCRMVDFVMADMKCEVTRTFDPHPFVPRDKERLDERCNDILQIQTAGLARRLETIKGAKAVIGLSGGLDSTLALLVTIKAMTLIGRDYRDAIVPVTMPGFGTTTMTLSAVQELCREFGLALREIPIREISADMLGLVEHAEDSHDTTYENIQARSRTYVLMSLANEVNGIVIGTGDLSEMALGWCTYNGDHISMYNVNGSVPKTLVKFLINRSAIQDCNDNVRTLLGKILEFPISPELLPSDGTEIVQKTEEKIGPYELHDFFLYYFVRWGFSHDKILFMAERAFAGRYSVPEIEKWLSLFIKRFFGNQWKRDCVPASPKVGSVDLSPRGSWRMSAESSRSLFDL